MHFSEISFMLLYVCFICLYVDCNQHCSRMLFLYCEKLYLAMNLILIQRMNFSLQAASN